MARGIRKGTKLGKWSEARKKAWMKARWGKESRNPTPSEISPISEPIQAIVEEAKGAINDSGSVV